jgi:hypothetical protein
MSVNCNKLIPFDSDTLEAKASLGRAVSVALNAALRHSCKAIEIMESSRAATGAEVVYLRASGSKLDTAVHGLHGMKEILVGGRLSEASVAWLKALDYNRLYSVGTEKGLIPRVIEQWSRLVALMESPDHLSVTDRLVADVEAVKRDIDAVIASSESGRADRLVKIQSAMIQLVAFAQMVSYLNNIEPMDPSWCRSDAGVDPGSAAYTLSSLQ